MTEMSTVIGKASGVTIIIFVTTFLDCSMHDQKPHSLCPFPVPADSQEQQKCAGRVLLIIVEATNLHCRPGKTLHFTHLKSVKLRP